MERKLFILGTASQVPTRTRNQHSSFLRWDAEGFLLDPGEGTQRQMAAAGLPASAVTSILVSHFHGDHCLGLPGVIQRLSLDRVPHPVRVAFPASGKAYYERLRDASIYHRAVALQEHGVEAEGVVWETDRLTLRSGRLDHVDETFGYRIEERDSRRMLKDRLERAGIRGPEVGRLLSQGEIRAGGRTWRLEELSEPRPGQVFAFVLDTRLTQACLDLAREADLAVIEATYLDRDRDLASEYGHLTAAQAGEIARRAGVRRLVVTHFSQRYQDVDEILAEAREAFGGDVVAAREGEVVAVPARREGG